MKQQQAGMKRAETKQNRLSRTELTLRRNGWNGLFTRFKPPNFPDNSEKHGVYNQKHGF